MTLKGTPNGAVQISTNAHAPSNKSTATYPGAQSWTAVEDEANGTHGKAPPRVYPHIKDLTADAQKKVQMYDTTMPFKTLLGHAQRSVNRVTTDTTYKRQDLAFVEYLISSDILLNLIPKHKDFPSYKTDRGQWGQLYTSLCRDNDAQHGMFLEIKDAIINDNVKNGTKPASQYSSSHSRVAIGVQQSSDRNGRRDSLPGAPARKQSLQDELFLDQTTQTPQTRHTQPHARPIQLQSRSKLDVSPHRERPPVHSKPDNLHSRPISRNGATQNTHGDALSERFSQLRIAQRNAPSGQNGTSQAATRSHMDMPSPSEYTSSSEASSIIRTHSHSSSGDIDFPSKPSGPRAMPLPPKVPPPPPKIPLNPGAAIELPRAPAPAYDPAKSILAPINTSVPSLNRIANYGGREQAPSMVARRPAEGPYISNGTAQPSRPTIELPKPQTRQTSISAAEFYEKLRTMTVLVVDVRSRAEFDEGHVHAKSILCIEPFILNSGMAAEDLEDRLVVSPEVEQSLFDKRNDFELVVYYDQRTKSDLFLRGPPTRTEANSLRALHDTLYEFNDYKPLRRPPIVLAGGLDAWVDLVGPQALATSKTAGLIGSTAARQGNRRPARPLGRVPMASANSSLEVRKRRLREQNTLNLDEEKKWLEKAKSEEVNPVDFQNGQSDEEGDGEGQLSPFTHSYEDFLRKFPEPSMIQQSMTTATPPPLPLPPPPSRIPPSKPSPPPLPSIPSRPAPAAPRPSYSGVSEQFSQFSPSSRQTSSSQYPLFTPRSSSRYLKLPHTGLVNFGVTCYMNATIQCLLATIPLSQLFLDNRWRDYLQKNWKGSNGILPGIFANLIRSLWCDDVAAIRPSSMRALCGSLKKEWGIDRQQDAKEFFDFVVDCLHEDLNVHWDRTPLRPLTTKEEMQREHMPIRQVSEIEWRRYSHREQSPISDYFAGQHASRLRCTTCHNTSTTYEAFYSISVEIPRSSSRKQDWDIHDCLRSYTQEERLSKDEMWKCPFCKCEREATKQITITRAPMYLVVHFKRFEMRKGEYSAKKVHTPIHFPLFGLDLGPYTLPPPTQQEVQQQQQSHDYVPEYATSPPYLYDAYAVMRHLGSTGNGGHYISLIRDVSRGCWRKFDDDVYTDFDPAKLKSGDRLQNEQAYILFYCRAPVR